MNKIILTLILFLLALVSIGQKYSTESKKAIKYYEEALQAYSAYDFPVAEEKMLKAIKADDQFIEAFIILGEIYTDESKRDLAIEAFKRAVAIDKDFYSGLYYNMAGLEMQNSNFQDALKSLNTFL